MKAKWILTVVAAVGLTSAIAFAALPGKANKGGKEPGRQGAFAGCEWVVETEDREATAECDRDSFVISGGCRLDQGAFREGFPEDIDDGDSVFEGTGWTCETTANQPITAAALCCPLVDNGNGLGRRR